MCPFERHCNRRLIHLPLLNFLLGFPIQLLGLALLPYFGVKYFVEKDSIKGDAGDAFVSRLALLCLLLTDCRGIIHAGFAICGEVT